MHRRKEVDPGFGEDVPSDFLLSGAARRIQHRTAPSPSHGVIHDKAGSNISSKSKKSVTRSTAQKTAPAQDQGGREKQSPDGGALSK